MNLWLIMLGVDIPPLQSAPRLIEREGGGSRGSGVLLDTEVSQRRRERKLEYSRQYRLKNPLYSSIYYRNVQKKPAKKRGPVFTRTKL